MGGAYSQDNGGMRDRPPVVWTRAQVGPSRRPPGRLLRLEERHPFWFNFVLGFILGSSLALLFWRQAGFPSVVFFAVICASANAWVSVMQWRRPGGRARRRFEHRMRASGQAPPR